MPRIVLPHLESGLFFMILPLAWFSPNVVQVKPTQIHEERGFRGAALQAFQDASQKNSYDCAHGGSIAYKYRVHFLMSERATPSSGGGE